MLRVKPAIEVPGNRIPRIVLALQTFPATGAEHTLLMVAARDRPGLLSQEALPLVVEKLLQEPSVDRGQVRQDGHCADQDTDDHENAPQNQRLNVTGGALGDQVQVEEPQDQQQPAPDDDAAS